MNQISHVRGRLVVVVEMRSNECPAAPHMTTRFNILFILWICDFIILIHWQVKNIQLSATTYYSQTIINYRCLFSMV